MKFAGRWVTAGAIGLATLGGVMAMSSRAQACGGLFCNAAMPVNQAAERIIFSIDKPNKKVTAVVEILYQGPAEKFAWVLPVPGIPTVAVSSGSMLDRLQSLTNPLYSIQRTWKDTCPGGGSGFGGNSGAADAAAGPPSAGGGGVSVIASGSAGPYVYEVIKVDATLADPGMAAVNWLKANAYDVDTLGGDVLRAYLRDGLNLLAFKLAKNRSVGSIRPVMLTYDSDHPMIPIRPTAVAANNDMGVLVFVLGKNRAVPTNYKTLELNEALIDWFQPNAAYNAVVTAAADEAQGQGFVTELASASIMTGIVNSIFPERFVVQQFRQQADGLDPPNLIVNLIENFSTFPPGGLGGPFGARPGGGRVALDGVADVISTALTLPAGVKVEDVLASPRCYLAAFRMPGMFYCNSPNGQPMPAPAEVIDLSMFDKVKFLTAVESLVIKPLEATAKLFADQPYLTRLYTTLSPAEMTLDPEFDLNAEIGDVSNVHQLTLEYTKGCFGDTSGPWQATVGGFLVKGMGNTWPFAAASATMPFNLRVLQLATTGKGTVTVNNSDTIAKAIGSQPVPPTGGGGAGGGGGGGAGVGGAGGSVAGSGGKGPAPGVDGGPSDATPAGDTSSGCSCSTASRAPAGAGLLVLLAPMLALFRRRRRHRGGQR